MAQRVSVEMTGTDKGVQQMFERQQREIDKLTGKLDKAGRAGRRSGKEQQAGILSAAGALTGYVAGLSAVRGAVALIAEEWRNVRKAQDAAAKQQVEAAGIARGVRENFKGDASLPDADIERRIVKVSERTGLPDEVVGPAIQSAVSARGTKSGETAFRAVEEAGRFTKDPQALEYLAGASLDILNSTGGDDPREALGFLVDVQGQSRVTSTDKLAKNIRGITEAVMLGETEEAGGELYAILSTLLNDTQGGPTATFERNLVQRVRDFAAANEEAFGEADDTFERLDVLKRDAQLREKFFKEVSFGEGKGAVEALTSGDAEVEALVKKVRRSISAPGPAQVPVFEGEVKRLGAGVFEPLADFKREGDVALEAALLNDDQAALSGEIREQIVKAIGPASGVDLPGFDTTNLDLSLGRIDADTAVSGDPIQAAITELKNRKQIGEEGADPFGFTASSQEDLDRVQNLIDRLESLREVRARLRAREDVAAGRAGGWPEAGEDKVVAATERQAAATDRQTAAIERQNVLTAELLQAQRDAERRRPRHQRRPPAAGLGLA